MSLIRFLLFLPVVGALLAVPRTPQYWKKKFFDLTQNIDRYPNVQSLWFTQKLDHFDMYNTATWQQRYYMNPSYYRNNSIIFLFIGGEGPEDGTWAGNPNVQYIQWAQEYGALIFDLEHRFFGKSWPIQDMETDSLRLLTSNQALADLAFFIQSMNQKFGFDNPRWVTFGGSYPGALAAWFRSKYPEYTVGSVASSAVVNLKLDFYEYAIGVNNDLKVTRPGCYSDTKAAFQLIQGYTMTESGRQVLNKKLHLVPPFNDNTTKLDITNLFGNLYNTFQGMSQYTYDGQNVVSETIMTDGMVCDIMQDVNGTTPDLLDRVFKLMMLFNHYHAINETYFENSYSDAIAPIATGNLSAMSDDDAAARGWMWLCCNELGFMQTTDMGDNVFGSTIPLNFFIDMCTDLFGNNIKMDHVYNSNWAAQKYYGGADKYSATNVVLPNGSLDPWHFTGATPPNNGSNGVTAFLINGTAHCSDMYPSYVGEPPALVPARAFIKSQVQQFIGYNSVQQQSRTTEAPSKGSSAFFLFSLLTVVLCSQ